MRFVALAFSLVVTSCASQTRFSGSVPVVPDPSPSPTEPPSLEALPEPPTPAGMALTWFWNCDSEPVPVPTSSDPEHAIVQGRGETTIDTGYASDMQMNFSGKVCPPGRLPRDIVFVIDVSGSMDGSDPTIEVSPTPSPSVSPGMPTPTATPRPPLGGGGGIFDRNNGPKTCGRLQAIENILAKTAAGKDDTQFGIVTFDGALVNRSTAFFRNRADLVKDIAKDPKDPSKEVDIAEIVCANKGDTSYQSGLQGAADILRTGRNNATKEIYFISDGEPSAGQEGRELANALKAQGVAVGVRNIPVVIATTMLGQKSDKILREEIASRGANGTPFHYRVENAEDLAKTLATLAENKIATVRVKYRALGTNDFKTIEVKDQLQGYTFTLSSLKIELENAPQGIEAVLEYEDTHQNRYTAGGKALWMAAPEDMSGGGKP